MSSEAQDARAIAGEAVPVLPDGISQQQIGAAVSKLISASIGDICVVMSKSTAHKFHSLADIEWMVMPAVLCGQFYVGAAASTDRGFTAPVAIITWARVSEELDRRLSSGASGPMRLKPDEWTSGDHYWLIDTAGAPGVIAAALHDLAKSQFAGKTVKVRTTSGVTTLAAVISSGTAAAGGAT